MASCRRNTVSVLALTLRSSSVWGCDFGDFGGLGGLDSLSGVEDLSGLGDISGLAAAEAGTG